MSITSQLSRGYAALRSRGSFFLLNGLLLFIFLYLIACQVALRGTGHLPPTLSHILPVLIWAGVFFAYGVFFVVFQNPVQNRITFASVIVTLVLLEILVRWVNPQPPFHKDVYRSPRPYTHFAGKPNGVFTVNLQQMGEPGPGTMEVRLNDKGFRLEHPLPITKPKEEYRVFVLGGSTVFNGYPLSHSIAGQIEERFRAHGHTQVHVYNFGVVGFISEQEMALLLHELIDYHPDLVIVYDGGNDIYEPFEYDPRPGFPSNFVSFEAGYQFLSKEATLNQMFATLLCKSCLLRTFFERALSATAVSLGPLRDKFAYGDPSWEAEVADRYILNLSKMCGLARGFDFQLYMFLQPMIFLNHDFMKVERNRQRPTAKYVLRQYDRIRPRLQELEQASERSHPQRCHFVDLSNILADAPQNIFWDIIHVKFEANQKIAQTICDYILQHGTVRGALVGAPTAL